MWGTQWRPSREPKVKKPLDRLGISELLHKRAGIMQWLMVGITVVLGGAIAGVVMAYLFFGLFRGDTAAPATVPAVIAGGITRVGAIIIAVYILQLLANFTRYGFRIADHLHATADALVLAGSDDPEKITRFIDALSPRHIGFDKLPRGVSEKMVAETLKRLSAS